MGSSQAQTSSYRLNSKAELINREIGLVFGKMLAWLVCYGIFFSC